MNDEERERPVVVYDTTTLMRATMNPNRSAEEAIQLMDDGKVEAYMSNEIRAEYEKTLSAAAALAQASDKEKDQERLRNVTLESVEKQLNRFDEKVNRLVNPPKEIKYERDSTDEPFLNLANHVNADFIVTDDGDLKALNNHPDWKEWFPNIKIIPPEALEREVALWHERKQEQELSKEKEREPEIDLQPTRSQERER